MSNEKVLEYVDEVILKTSASKEFKMKLENELIRHIILATKNTSVDEVINKLGSTKVLADRMSRKLIPEISKELNKIFIKFEFNHRSCEELAATETHDTNHHSNHHHSNHHRLQGEYMREESNVNIKLLYIPLIQICSGIERVRLPYVDDRFFE